ncbi:hypothetical protein [Streptomyces sp. NBC_01237]|uniref:hypothetical protein n=1 Tax=Streptomyces sp. NBC_01237 TaxID=2903790 RepID=UPI002DD84AF1|nr:hypothetical protein [Streptomyces sp. NBC_01237]WRZ77451.1 hypothetical protein OG251_38125 [Streptomyces sp. NBC_01237]
MTGPAQDADGIATIHAAIAWLLAPGPGRQNGSIVTLIGAGRPRRIAQALSAAVGDRHAAPRPAQPDSEH